jgi:hypothetical protein
MVDPPHAELAGPAIALDERGAIGRARGRAFGEAVFG